MAETIRAAAVRRLAVAAQGFTGRYRRATGPDVEAAIRRLSCVQLDSISTVERSHRIALAGRVGDYPPEAVSRLLARGRIFEYWAHEACLLPIESWPLFHAARENGGRGWYGAVGKTHPHLADEILAEIRERGPLASRHFEGATGGGMWNWKPAKAMLERLWNHGDLVIAGRQGFQRVYDLAERVIPRAQLEAPMPSEHEVASDAGRAGRTRPRRPHRRRRQRALAAAGRRRPRATRARRARRRRPAASAARRRRRRRRARPRRRRARPAGPARRRAAEPVRQPALGPALSRAGSSTSTT